LKQINFCVIILFLFKINCALSQSWVQKSSLPISSGLLAPFSFSINNKLYVGGGYNGTSPSNLFFEYDEVNDSWISKANLPVGIYAAACFSINDKGYVVCGASPSLSNQVFCYDQITNSWQTKSNFPGFSRMNCRGFELNGKGYLYGGFLGGSSTSAEMWEYNPITDSWLQKMSCPGSGRNVSTTFVINNRAFVGLGTNSSATANYTDLYEFNPTANSYSAISSLLVGRSSGASFTIGQNAYVGVGFNSPSGSVNYNNEFWKYDLQSNSWTKCDDFNGLQKENIFSQSINGKPFIGCGGNNSGYMRDVWTWKNCNYNLDLGNDTSICNGQGIYLGDSSTNATFLWSNGQSSSNIAIQNSGTYWLELSKDGCVYRDSITVMVVNPLMFNLGADTGYCGNFTRLLSTGDPNTFWSTGNLASSISVSTSGLYHATISNNCGVYSDSIYIIQHPVPDFFIGNDTAICNSDSLFLDATVLGASYLWSTGETSPIIVAYPDNIYSVTAFLNPCVNSGVIRIDGEDSISKSLLPNDTSYCRGQQLILILPSELNPIWNDSINSNSLIINRDGLHYYNVTNSCGGYLDSVFVISEYCDCNVVFPSAFSPNGDGVNDNFGPIFRCGQSVTDFDFSIFNRWGEVVFKTNNPFERWDGYFKGEEQPVEVYVYTCRFHPSGEGRLISKIGNFTLIR
jgi:gliding motility-associated-like protein